MFEPGVPPDAPESHYIFHRISIHKDNAVVSSYMIAAIVMHLG
jgi:hypothetical protein